jgi:hypothetical protein
MVINPELEPMPLIDSFDFWIFPDKSFATDFTAKASFGVAISKALNRF